MHKMNMSRWPVRALLPAALGIAGTCVGPLPASAAAVFAPAFGGPALDPGLAESGTTGTGFSVGNGALVLTQAAGNPNGSALVTATTALTGDFSARVTVYGSALGLADGGLLITSADSGAWLSDTFMNGNSHTVNANVYSPFNGVFLPTSASTVTLTVSRSGDTITDTVSIGSDLVTLNSETSAVFGQAVDIGLFLLGATGATGADAVTFANFGIQPIPEPATLEILAPAVLSLAGLRLVSRRGRVAAFLTVAARLFHSALMTGKRRRISSSEPSRATVRLAARAGA